MIELHFASPLLKDERTFATLVRNSLSAIAWLNCATLKAQPTFPLLFQSGVVFRNEPRGIETFVDCVDCLDQGWGDCAHVTAWRVAELRVRYGVRARLCIKWKRLPEKKLRLFHVMARLPNGAVENTSKLLIDQERRKRAA